MLYDLIYIICDVEMQAHIHTSIPTHIQAGRHTYGNTHIHTYIYTCHHTATLSHIHTDTGTATHTYIEQPDITRVQPRVAGLFC